MKNPWVIIGVICVVLIGGAIWYSGVAAEQNNEGITFSPHIKGNPAATVTLVEYSDFECPACAAFQPVLAEVMNAYRDTLKLEFRHFPLPGHRNSQAAARAAEAAGQQGKFFEYHDVLFSQQQEWVRSPNPTVLFYQYAEEIGLDVDTFRRHFNAPIIRDRVEESFADARAQNLTGTPTFFLNGEQMQIETYEDFVDQISRAIDPSYVPPGAEAAGGEVRDSGVRFGL